MCMCTSNLVMVQRWQHYFVGSMSCVKYANQFCLDQPPSWRYVHFHSITFSIYHFNPAIHAMFIMVISYIHKTSLQMFALFHPAKSLAEKIPNLHASPRCRLDLIRSFSNCNNIVLMLTAC